MRPASAALPRPGHPCLAGAPLLIAHRGGAMLAPENTLLAFDRALRWWRVDLVELDVRVTRDGEAVVIHDASLDRTTDGSGAVAVRTLAELRELDAGFAFTPDRGSSHPFRGRGVRIPTLAEVLDAFPGARLNVEIKDRGAQGAVWSAIHAAAAQGRVLVAADQRANRRRFDRYAGPISASRAELIRFYIRHRLGLGRFRSPGVDALQMPERYGGRQVLGPRFIRNAHACNVPVHVWTVDDPGAMRRLLGWGVDGIVTDRPDVLAQVLHEHAHRPLPPGSPKGEAEPFHGQLRVEATSARAAP